ncbi:MAG: hypothetical protein K2M42_03645 [Oscillospiraceae bacterium]|nr:hypothetical protein [Oscillospiraceae bacterium]
MSKRGIVLHLDERWYDALSRQLNKKDTTVEDELDAYLDAMIDQLPEQVRERISREIWEEEQRERQAAEAARRFSVFRITQDGRTDHLLTEGAGSMDALHTAMRLRAYLLRKGNSSERFAEAIPAADHIAPEVFLEYADELRQGTGRMVSALDIDLDRGEFSTLDTVDGWETYTIRDVSVAAWHANRRDGMTWEWRLNRFTEQLEGKEIATPDHLAEQDISAQEGPGIVSPEQTM